MSNITNFQRQINLEPMSIVVETWANMLDTYSILVSTAGTQRVPPVWESNLKNLSIEDIERGWPRMEKEHPAHPPTPMQFVSLCKVRPEDKGYPCLEDAYQQAIGNSSHKHSIVSLTCREMGSRASDIRQMPDKQARKIFEGFYLEVVDKVGKGHLEVPKVIREDADAVRHTSIELVNIQAEYVKKIMDLFNER